ncbi:MAG: hypothetical protein DRN30_01005 [Thermoplasmata archaeon]|nr:hypothetical protein [Euryarchaeota archaeon]RLF66983.1 MAG: hypothetical protein DRN30_01005 [Thermoplasmata archaeon]
MIPGIYEAIIFIRKEPYVVGVKLPEKVSYVFEGSKLYDIIEKGLDVLVWFPEWRDLEILVRVSLGRKEGVEPPPQVFHWRIENVYEKKYFDDLGNVMVKVVKYSGDIDSTAFSGNEISRGRALALEAAVVYSRLIKYPHVGWLHEKYWSTLSEAIRLCPDPGKELLSFSGMPKVLWVITGGYTWLNESLNIIERLRKKCYVKVLLTDFGAEILKKTSSTSISAVEGKKAYYEASSVVSGRYDIVVVSPATSNTVSKILLGIADTPATIAATHAFKLKFPVIILPTDYKGEMYTEEEKYEIPLNPYFKYQVELLKALGYYVVKDPKELMEVLRRYIPTL